MNSEYLGKYKSFYYFSYQKNGQLYIAVKDYK